MNRIKGILAAGTMTGLIIITVVVLGFRSTRANQADQTATPGIVVQPVVLPNTSTGSQLAAPAQGNTQADQSQAYINQLESALKVMQAREAQYQSQIEAANQTILQLQSQLSAQAAPSPFQGGEGHAAHEEHEGHDD